MENYTLGWGCVCVCVNFFVIPWSNEDILFPTHRGNHPIHQSLILRVQNILVCCWEQGGKTPLTRGRKTPHCNHIAAVLLLWIKYCFVQNVKFWVSVFQQSREELAWKSSFCHWISKLQGKKASERSCAIRFANSFHFSSRPTVFTLIQCPQPN